MTAFRSCAGCVLDGQPCATRDALKTAIAGLGIRSVKWHCKARAPRFVTGDQVWAETYSDYGSRHYEGEGGYDDSGVRADFPGVIINVVGSKALVFIEKGAISRDFGDDYPFEPNNGGFCKIPLSRLTKRDGERETICKSCQWPERLGHQVGYICHHELRRMAEQPTAVPASPSPPAADDSDEEWPF